MAENRFSQAVSPAKHRAITAAAGQIFAMHGYEGANLDLIAQRANVSKQTIYNHFGGKEALFRSIVADLTAELTAPLQFDAGSHDFRSILVELGERCLDVSLRPSSLALHRLIISAAPRFPDLGPSIYEAGASRMLIDLARVIKQQCRTGTIAVPDPADAAEQFFGMLTGFAHFRALLGVKSSDKIWQRKRVLRTVDAFLHLCRTSTATGKHSAATARTKKPRLK